MTFCKIDVNISKDQLHFVLKLVFWLMFFYRNINISKDQCQFSSHIFRGQVFNDPGRPGCTKIFCGGQVFNDPGRPGCTKIFCGCVEGVGSNWNEWSTILVDLGCWKHGWADENQVFNDPGRPGCTKILGVSPNLGGVQRSWSTWVVDRSVRNKTVVQRTLWTNLHVK